MSKGLATHSSGKATVIQPQDEVFNTRGVVTKLEDLMTRVTANHVTPETVNAACNCADKIVDILRLHLDVQRMRQKIAPRAGV